MSSKMSKDRVRFELPDRMQSKEYLELVEKVFGLYIPYNKDKWTTAPTVSIICRPSQFARFLILRNTLEIGSNDFKGLKAVLYTPEDAAEVKDVSKNPNTIRSEPLNINP